MADNIHLEIVTPNQVAYSKAVDSVVVSGIEGEMEIFKDHISLITFLKAGKIIAKNGANTDTFFSTGGTVEFSNNKLSILLDNFFNSSEFQSEELEKLKQNAEKKLSNKEISDEEIYLNNQVIDQINNLKS
ncbi:MAG: ATP synthase F1 subunit epsilon [Candidatus Fonsibacter lacus]|jgi:F-type H+-transporting ATPase subunit epsilon|nr:ATP synthase F1 subunit epsilon [Candidatus Fonsibacter lacus]NBQ46624.1 ATP synthase F1 subunit epsilon [Pseudomonadota bacterium]NCU49077.1 ATP synthase F1 subunit epsilon [Candidatus Fonsibacter lacus]NDC44098.1 ATP synthase F1 subunit epsilon [Pseudomonadota bacterium]